MVIINVKEHNNIQSTFFSFLPYPIINADTKQSMNKRFKIELGTCAIRLSSLKVAVSIIVFTVGIIC